jgi:hypothetical protein
MSDHPNSDDKARCDATYVIGHDGSGLVTRDGLVGQTPGSDGGLSAANGEKESTSELQGNHD